MRYVTQVVKSLGCLSCFVVNLWRCMPICKSNSPIRGNNINVGAVRSHSWAAALCLSPLVVILVSSCPSICNKLALSFSLIVGHHSFDALAGRIEIISLFQNLSIVVRAYVNSSDSQTSSSSFPLFVSPVFTTDPQLAA